MTEFATYGPFEDVIAQARAGKKTKEELIGSFLAAEVVLPSGAPAEGSDEIVPLLFEVEGATMLAVFTDPRRIGEFADIAPYLITMSGRDIMVRLPPDGGIVINPTTAEVGFEISPEAVAATLQNLNW